jgi:hypothetical protein
MRTPAVSASPPELLETLASRRRLVLGVELVYTRQQDILDRRQDGSIDDRTFLRRIHYREEWGYPWDGFRDLLDRARTLGIPVIALDRSPRGGFDGLRRRDAHAARGIATVLSQRPRSAMLVLFGESHLARGHVPREVERALARRGIARTAVTVFQDPEPCVLVVVVSLPDRPGSGPLRGRCVCVFHTPPLTRYESYRQVLEGGGARSLPTRTWTSHRRSTT